MLKNKIGIFDSGIGGVTVLEEILKILPNENYIYYSDSKNNPYGDKSDQEIIKIADNIVSNLIEYGCKAIVIACNTASAKASQYLRKKYCDIPIIVIEPAYKMINDYANSEETLIIATKATIESEKFKNLYNRYNNDNTYVIACSGLADLIENHDQLKIKNYLKENLREYATKVKNVVLGCTHYVLIKEELREILGDITFFEGSVGVANNLKRVLTEKDLLSSNNLRGSIIFKDSNLKESVRIDKENRFYKYLKDNL